MDLLIDRAPELYVKTIEHLMLTGISTGAAVLIGLPLGIWVTRYPRLRGPVLGVAGIVQTIPSLAMLAFLLPFFGIGVRPALIALTLYAVLPIVRNTYTGLCEVSGEVIEAAQGLGFTRRQRLFLVEMPLALPIIVAGIRTATVIGVGIATLSAFIGAGGLGDFINRGLALNNTRLILLGAIPAAMLALLLDFGIGFVEALLRPGRLPAAVKRRAVLFFSISALLVLLAAGLFFSSSDRKSAPSETLPIRVGSKNFTEQIILGELFAQSIEAHTGLEVIRRFNLGGTILCHRALVNGEIDLYPEYTGTAQTAILKLERLPSGGDAFEIVSSAYRNRFACEWLLPLGFNSTYAITVRKSAAEAKGWAAISDLAGDASGLRAGFTAEFSERPDGYPGLQDAYGFRFGKAFDLDPGLMYKAVAQGEVDVICAFATDGRIDAYELFVLKDDRGFFPQYLPCPVVRKQALEAHPELRRALECLAGTLPDRAMQRLNFEVDEKGRSPAEVAREFLEKKGFL
jgi:osmoprotectant transport system permease protein